MNARAITIIGASAGSGKTYRLTKEVTDALSRAEAPIDVTNLVAVTFTRKAHTELEARIRQELVSIGAYEKALQLPLAYVGTIHAVALRLLQEFAIDAGLSPSVDVIAGNETKLLRQAFELTLDEPTRARLDELAARVELRLDRFGRTDWLSPCADIMDLARSNRIAPEDLPAMAQRSVESLRGLLPPPVRDGLALQETLATELEAAGRRLVDAKSTKANTARAIELIRASSQKLYDNELRWSGWAKLADITPEKQCERHVSDLRLAAARYEEHPRFHADLSAMTRAIFDAARVGLLAYQAWKKERQVVDYVDMLDGALSLLDTPRAQKELADRLRLVVVDEFQDTSPIQLALFLRLHQIAGRSIWVGDRKQCIFEYAGADPVLMDSVSAWVDRQGGTRDRLGTNHRSRPELVDACSELFALTLARHGFERDEVVVRAHRTSSAESSALPPLGLWKLGGRNRHDDLEAIADGIRRMLEAPHQTPIVDRVTGATRPVRAGDIAVLTTTNEWAGALARALHARGIRAATARAGLFDTPEGTLLDAALRWLLDSYDGLAAANIDALTGWDGATEDDWLSARIRAQTAAPETTTPPSWWSSLEPIRKEIAWLAPVEAVDVTLSALDVVQLCARWPDSPQRVANIDSLRAVATQYEERCAQEREAATVAGLLRYFDDIRSPVLQRDELLPSDDQHVPTDEGAVVVCTYHKSKGLEWPVVILANLDRGERRDAFEVTPQSDDGAFDPEHPLANRRIRYWVWPFGGLKNVPLRDRAESSTEGKAVSAREERERARLLYVGFTRARDHLVLAIRVEKGKPQTAWLDSLNDQKQLELPFSASDQTVASTVVGPQTVATRVWQFSPGVEVEKPSSELSTWFVRAESRGEVGSSYRINPSGEIVGWPELDLLVGAMRIGQVERFEAGITLRGRPTAYDVLGHGVHAFLATDIEDLDKSERSERAQRLVEGWAIAGLVDPPSLLRAGDALRAWVSNRWPGAKWHREVPIETAVRSVHGERWVSGIIDLLIETADGFILIDHKSFPAPHESAWRAKCETFIPQLAAYRLVVEAVTTRRVLETWIHLPLGGGMVNIRSGR